MAYNKKRLIEELTSYNWRIFWDKVEKDIDISQNKTLKLCRENEYTIDKETKSLICFFTKRKVKLETLPYNALRAIKRHLYG